MEVKIPIFLSVGQPTWIQSIKYLNIQLFEYNLVNADFFRNLEKTEIQLICFSGCSKPFGMLPSKCSTVTV